MAKEEPQIKWHTKPQEHDYPAAEEYLSLIFPKSDVKVLVKRLAGRSMCSFHAKDIFRASRLPSLPEDNYHVAKNIGKIKSGLKLSPILLIKHNGLLIIADGYHRLCAVYIFNEDVRIPCQIVSYNYTG
jgi:hypothetical protein